MWIRNTVRFLGTRYLELKERVAEAGKLVSQSPPPHQQILATLRFLCTRYLEWEDRVAEAGKLVSQSPPPHQQILVAQP
jgi:hypothetical protein